MAAPFGVRQFDQLALELDAHLQANPMWDLAGPAWRILEQPGDPRLVRSVHYGNRSLRLPALYEGRVQYGIPHLGWYRVIIGNLHIVKDCYLAHFHSRSILGPAPYRCLAPDTPVLVFLPAGALPGIIVAVDDGPMIDGSIQLPDWIVPGSRVGYRWLGHYRELLMLDQTKTVKALQNFSHGAPVDQLSGDYSLLSVTGGGLHIDNFLAFLRMGEYCGLFLYYLDQAARLAGHNLDIWSSHHLERFYEEAGRLVGYRGYVAYPWEFFGYFEKSATPDREKERFPHATQEQLMEGRLPLVNGAGSDSFARLEEHTGFHARGWMRQVLLPAVQPGENSYYADGLVSGNPPRAVFREGIRYDGSYYLSSCHSIILAKRPVTAPFVRRKFSEQIPPVGEDENISIKSFPLPQEESHVYAGSDLVSWLLYQMDGTAGILFRKDKQRYVAPREHQLATRKPMERSEGIFGYKPPDAEVLPVDMYQQQEKYYPVGSYIGLLPDGQIVLQGSCGEAIRMVAGDLILTAPRRIVIQSGDSTVILAGKDLVARARHSADVTAGEGTVRLKAETDLQLLAGNGGSGGILIESRGSNALDYPAEGGEMVRTQGVIIKSANNRISLLGRQLNLQSTEGDIAINAGYGQHTVYVIAGSQLRFLRHGSRDIYGSPDRPSRVDEHSVSVSRLDCHLIAGRSLLCGGFATFNGQVTTASGHFASPQGGLTGKLPDVAGIRQNIQRTVVTARNTAMAEASSLLKQAAELSYPEEDLEKISFSLRTDAEYGVDERFALLEAPWQQWIAIGYLPSSGKVWQEPVVVYQGMESQSQLPWPGRKAWQSATLWSTDSGILASNGVFTEMEDEDWAALNEGRTTSQWRKRVPEKAYYVY